MSMRKAFCAGFVALLLGALLATLLIPDRTFSDMENRVLQTLPTPSASTVFSGKWMDDMESWLADQFPGRTFFVRTKASLNALLGQREIGGAYIGADGQLFEVFDPEVDAEQLDKNVELVNRFAATVPGKVIFLPAYSAFTLYPERLPAFAQEPDERAILSSMALDASIALADPYEALLAQKEQGAPIYFRTDHHWTQQGAYAAYVQYCALAGLTPLSNPVRVDSPNPFYGSLFSKAPLWTLAPDEMFYYEVPRTVSVTYDLETTSDSLYALDALNKKDQYTLFLDGNHARVDIETDAGTGRTLIVLKDSFGHALVPLLANHYDHIVMLDLRYYNLPLSQLVEEMPDADVLLTYNLSWFAQDKNLFKLVR